MSTSEPIPSPDAIAAFTSFFSHSPSLCAIAPGRVNLIGEHTDYNQGFVFPVAIDRHTTALFSQRDDERFVCHSMNAEETIESDIEDLSGFRKKGWFSYVAGVASLLAAEGIEVRGSNCLIHSTIPIGGGLSSSAALEVSVALGLLALAGRSLPTDKIMQLCQKAEWDWAGVSCGIMDQFISVRGVSNAALLIDCKTLEYLTIPIDPSLVMTICDTNVPHTLSSSAYNSRLTECGQAVQMIQHDHAAVVSLRDVTTQMLRSYHSTLDTIPFRRARHVVSENERVLEASDALWYKDHVFLGELLDRSHTSLRHDYEVSSSELDIMTEICRSVDGVYGARMVGAGFGGSVLALSTPAASPNVHRAVMDAYKTRTGIEPNIISCRTAGGARVIRLR